MIDRLDTEARDSGATPDEPLDREDPRASEALFRQFFPDEKTRRAVLDVLCTDIAVAHEVNPSSWSVTLDRWGRFFRLNVGKIFALSIYSDRLNFIHVDNEESRDAIASISTLASDEEHGPFKALTGIEWRRLPLPELHSSWSSLREFHHTAIKQAAKHKTPFFRSHSPGILDCLDHELGATQPRPEHPEPEMVSNSQVDHMVDLVRSVFPEWDSTQDQRFVDDEITYKRKAAALAQRTLGRSEFQRLLAEREFDEIVTRVKKVGQATNLMFLGVPLQGGLAVVHQPDVDRAALSEELFQLLHGEGESPQRLGRWADWVDRNGLPNKWTFPTYLLFLLHPETEMFVKPVTTTRFLSLLGIKGKIRGRPDPAKYAMILRVSQALLESFGEYGATDMIDVQSILWVFATASKKTRYWKVSPGKQAEYWDQCLRDGYIGIGWNALGDIIDIDRKEFEKRLRRCAKEIENWKAIGAEQAWRFVNEVKEGDKIVANRGTGDIVGVGTVTGPHYYEPSDPQHHRVPVNWEISEPIPVNEGGWKRTLIELPEAKFNSLVPVDSPPPARDGWFSQETFELLKGLAQNPTYAWYEEQKDEFKNELEKPFRSMFNAVADRLPEPIKARAETSKSVFSRIPKNDWGRGGAWPHYWGAFYPKGGKRTQGSQLFAVIKDGVLRFGFGFGSYSGDNLIRFLNNLKKHRAVLAQALCDHVTVQSLVFGKLESRGEPRSVSLKDWINDPESFDAEIQVVLNTNQVLSKTRDELVDEITELFTQLMPFFILSVDDDPIEEIQELLGEDQEHDVHPAYSIDQMVAETGFEKAELQRWVAAVERKKQAILYGPPGTGKTFVAERLARHLIAGGSGQCDLVQFHPAYAYEDFIQGIRPMVGSSGELSYDMAAGRFLNFCRAARTRPGRSVLIVDEINRANLARVFGELMYLLEYRGSSVPLAGGGALSIPENVRLIGTMNTADRSIALVDHALRRRFAFIYLRPNFQILRKYHRDTEVDIDSLVEILEDVNRQIGDPHYEVGISFFLRKDLEQHIADIWRMEIEPYLEEFFFDQKDKIEKFQWDRIQGKLIS